MGTAERDLVDWLAPDNCLNKINRTWDYSDPISREHRAKFNNIRKQLHLHVAFNTHTPQQKVMEDFGRHLQKPEYDVGETICGITLNFPE